MAGIVTKSLMCYKYWKFELITLSNDVHAHTKNWGVEQQQKKSCLWVMFPFHLISLCLTGLINASELICIS